MAFFEYLLSVYATHLYANATHAAKYNHEVVWVLVKHFVLFHCYTNRFLWHDHLFVKHLHTLLRVTFLDLLTCWRQPLCCTSDPAGHKQPRDLASHWSNFMACDKCQSSVAEWDAWDLQLRLRSQTANSDSQTDLTAQTQTAWHDREWWLVMICSVRLAVARHKCAAYVLESFSDVFTTHQNLECTFCVAALLRYTKVLATANCLFWPWMIECSQRVLAEKHKIRYLEMLIKVSQLFEFVVHYTIALIVSKRIVWMQLEACIRADNKLTWCKPHNVLPFLATQRFSNF